MARPRGLSEVALSRDSKKISDLMQLHVDSPTTNVRFDSHQLCEHPVPQRPSVYCSLCATRKIMRRPPALLMRSKVERRVG